LNLHAYALISAVIVLESALLAINWMLAQLEKTEEYSIRIKLLEVRAKRLALVPLLSAARFDAEHKITASIAKVWIRKGAIAKATLDKIFSLN